MSAPCVIPLATLVPLRGSANKRVSGYVPSALRPNPSLSLRTSDTRQDVIGNCGAYKHLLTSIRYN